MADRHERVILEAITALYEAGMRRAGVETEVLEARVATLNKTTGAFDASGRGIVKTLSAMSSGELAVGAAAAVAGAVILKMTKDGVAAYVHLADQVRQYQRVTGDSAEESSIMIERAKVLGVSTDSLALAVFRMSKNVETNRDLLRAHGVELAYNADGSLNLTRTLDALNAAHHRAGGGANFDRVAQAALGRGAQRLLPLLTATRERLDEIDAGARRHHMVLNDHDLENALQYKIAVHEMHDAWIGVEQELGAGVLPLLTDLAHSVDEIVTTLDTAGAKVNVFTKSFGGTGTFAGGVFKDLNKPLAVAVDLLRGHFKGALIDLIPAGNTFHNVFDHLFGHHNHDAEEAKRKEQELRDQFAANEQAVKDYSESLDLLFAGTFGVSSSTDKFETDLAGAYTGLKKAKDAGDGFASSLSTSSTTGLANRAMLQGLETDLANAAKKYKELHPQATDAEIRKALSGQIAQLQVLLGYFSGDNAEAQRLRDVLNDIAGIDLSKPGKTYHFGWGGHITNPFGGDSSAPPPAPPIDTGADTGSKADVGAFLQSLWERRMEQVKNRFHEGRASLAEYERSLDEQMAHEAPWTDKWVQLQQEKADAVHYWTDAVAAYLQALASKQSHLEDNMFEVGAIGTDAYIDLLQKRLAALQMYSDEWVRVFKEIEHLQGDALDLELKLIAAYDAGRQFQIGFDAAAQQRALYGSLTPVASGVSNVTTVSYGPSWSPSFTAVGKDAQQALDLSSQKLRDFAVSR
jgi:hypothetical protein